MADTEKRKKRRGDTKSGRWLRSLDPYYSFAPFIMKARSDALVYFQETIEVTEIDRFLRKKRAEGLKGLGMLELIIAAYVRTVSQRPALNRYISGQRIYARNRIEYVMSIKKTMSSEGGETSIKVIFDPRDTLTDVYNKMNAAIEPVKNGGVETSTDDVAAKLVKIPRPLLNMAVSFLNWMDYHGLLPQSLLDASPFHGSIIITDLGSLGIQPVFHHIYNFGNLPIFVSFGAKRHQYELDKDGNTVDRKYVDYTVCCDERICDGFYFAQSLKFLKNYMRFPEQLDTPPKQVFEDVD